MLSKTLSVDNKYNKMLNMPFKKKNSGEAVPHNKGKKPSGKIIKRLSKLKSQMLRCPSFLGFFLLFQAPEPHRPISHNATQ